MLWLWKVFIQQLHLNVWPVYDVLEVLIDRGHVFVLICEVLLPDEDLFVGIFLQSLEEEVVKGFLLFF